MTATKLLLAASLALAGASVAQGAFIETFEGFSTGGLAEGTTILSGMPGEAVLTSTGPNNGLAIFDSNTGSASTGVDPDLIVNSGNVLILQDTFAPGGFPNDSNEGGSIFFDFVAMGGENLSAGYIDLIDFNGGSASVFTLTDAGGNTRTFNIPNDFTGDPLDGFPGIDRLFFNGGDQNGNGPGMPLATVMDDAGFDITSVTQIEFAFGGSGALDNFAAIPMPAPLALAGAGLLGIAGIRRR